jgi:hypothetical protein
LIVALGWAASWEIDREAEGAWRDLHELSIASGFGRCFGSMPGVITSMIIMRLPQQGQGKFSCGCRFFVEIIAQFRNVQQLWPVRFGGPIALAKRP